jgi:hypothetical protein
MDGWEGLMATPIHELGSLGLRKDRLIVGCYSVIVPAQKSGWARASTTGRNGGPGTTRILCRARHRHDGHRARLCSSRAFPCRAWAGPSCLG